MSLIPSDLKYTRSHEWVRIEDNIITVGITEHAQSLLGDLVFVELPEVGEELSENEDASVVESVKAAADVYAPVSGTITEVNEALIEAPELVNQEPYGAGWIFKLEVDDEEGLAKLLDAQAYSNVITSEAH